MRHGLTNAVRGRLYAFRDLLSLSALVRGGHVGDIRILKAGPEQRVTLVSDGLRLCGSYFAAADGERRPGIVLTHGSSSQGRRLALTQVLAATIRNRGYHVLTYDARCYGESDHPATADDAAGFEFAHDVSAAVDWLAQRPDVDDQRLFVMGHSFGAGAALAAEAKDSRIAKLVLFGPPRRLRERFFRDDAPHRERILSRMQRDMNVPYRLNGDIVGRMLAERDIEKHVARFQEEGHTPLLLVDAAWENQADLSFLRDVRMRMSPRVMHWTVPGANHYLNTGRLLGRVIYPADLVSAFVARVDRFLRSG